MRNSTLADPVTSLHNKIRQDNRFERTYNHLIMNLTDHAFAEIENEVPGHDNPTQAVIELGGYSEIIRSVWDKAIRSTFSEPHIENFERGSISVRRYFDTQNGPP